MIIISDVLIKDLCILKCRKKIDLISYDGGDVYTTFVPRGLKGNIPGSIILDSGTRPNLTAKKDVEDAVKVYVSLPNNVDHGSYTSDKLEAKGYIRKSNYWKEDPVMIVPIKEKLFSRIGGLYETDVLSPKNIFIIGLGSGGSQIVLELSKSGAMILTIMDDDRMEIGNTARHVGYIQDIGRFKTNTMKDVILSKNPKAQVETIEKRVTWETINLLREQVRNAEFVICATDNQESKRIINRVCIEENKPCIYAGAFRRAYGGQILFVKPHETPCYQCFLMYLPEQAQDQEISNHQQASGLAYTDKPVPIEPGLSTDIAPISLMVVKLTIQELLKGTETTLASLDQDLIAPWYFWLNRREKGTQYAALEPLGFNVDGLHVLRWYGVDLKKHPKCPVCGNFEIDMLQQQPHDYRQLLAK